MFPVNVSSVNDSSSVCESGKPVLYHSILFGADLAVPEWEAIITTLVLSIIIVFTITGNILVIMSVFTYRPLKTVQNFFIVSLAVADIFVASLVLPLNVAYMIIGRWLFGIHICKLWLTADVMCCTASILNLCVIALDRFWAISKPLDYKRTLELVLSLILSVWVLSLLISSPPLLGWNDWPAVFTEDSPCQLTSKKGYVIYSALGSFFIPLAIMTTVYIEIFIATRRRLRERARAASKVNTYNSNKCNNKNIAGTMTGATQTKTHADNEITMADAESISSETNYNEVQNKTENENIPIVNKNCAKMTTPIKQQSNEIIQQVVTHDDESNTYQPENSSESTKNDADTKVLQPKEKNCSSIMHITTGTRGGLVKKRKSVKKTGGISQFIEERQKISLSKERRAARVLGIVMGVFVVCWLPFFLMYVILPFCDTCCPSERLMSFITWLGYINSALNPIIYTIFNMDFRKAFKKLLRLKV